MSNTENLLRGNPDTQFKTGPEQSEIARKGGIASGIAKRKRKALSETIELLLSNKVKDKKSKQKLKDLGFETSDQDLQLLLAASEFQRALNGDKESRDFLLKSIGENVNNESDNSNGGTIIVDDLEYIDEEDSSQD